MKQPVLALLAVVALSGCIETDSDITGTIQGTSFEVLSGSAESVGDSFIITLADTAEFSCSSVAAPPANYLQVVIAEISEPKTYQAADTVSFNVVEDEVGRVSEATGGTVVIDSVNDTSIEGSIDASSSDSSISGNFTVEICP